jgi:ubiquitin-conjugating enzyme (huntingtin interacting protein 2)
MASNRARRIAKEIQDIEGDTQSNINVSPLNDGDLMHLKGSFTGPPDTPYEGGKYHIDIKIPSDYPFRPPVMKFDTKIWHPNVSSVTGAICLDTLGTAWSPVLTIKSALISLQSLLSSPEPKDPQDAEVAGMLLKNPEQFRYVAREWAVKHAGAPKKETGEGSGGATPETIRAKAAQAKQNQERTKVAQYVSFLLLFDIVYEEEEGNADLRYQISRLQQTLNRPFLRYGFHGTRRSQRIRRRRHRP